MSYRTRWTRRLSGVAVAAAVALAAAGCTSGTAGSAGGGTAPTAPAVTAAQASQALDAYLATSDKAARTGDEKLALSEVTGFARSEVSYDFAAEHAARQPPPYLRYIYKAPALYLPAAAGYPRWFAASVTSYPRPPLGDIESNLAQPVMLLFTQASATAPWLLASRANVEGSMPRLAVDSGGRTPVVALSQTGGLVVRPDVVGPLLAAVVDEGSSSPAARFVSDDPYTMSYYQVGCCGNGFSTPRGDVRQWELDGTNYPQFALRTADGGALVFFAMYENTTIAVPSALNSSEPVLPGPPIKVPGDMGWMLPARMVPRVKLERQDLYSFVAVDPPSGQGKIQLIAGDGFLNYASAS